MNKDNKINNISLRTVDITNSNFIDAVKLMNEDPTEGINTYGEFTNWDLSNVDNISTKLFDSQIELEKLLNLGFTVEHLKQKLISQELKLAGTSTIKDIQSSNQFFTYKENFYMLDNQGLYKVDLINKSYTQLFSGYISLATNKYSGDQYYLYNKEDKTYIIVVHNYQKTIYSFNLDDETATNALITKDISEYATNYFREMIGINDKIILITNDDELITYSLDEHLNGTIGIDKLDGFKPGKYYYTYKHHAWLCVNGTKCYMTGGKKNTDDSNYNVQLYELDTTKALSNENPKMITNYSKNEQSDNGNMPTKMKSWGKYIIFAHKKSLVKLDTTKEISNNNPVELLNTTFLYNDLIGQVILDNKYYAVIYDGIYGKYKFGYYDLNKDEFNEIEFNYNKSPSSIRQLTVYNNIIYLNGPNIDNIGEELWKYDPSNDTKVMFIKDIKSGASGSNSYLWNGVYYNDKIYFANNYTGSTTSLYSYEKGYLLENFINEGVDLNILKSYYSVSELFFEGNLKLKDFHDIGFSVSQILDYFSIKEIDEFYSIKEMREGGVLIGYVKALGYPIDDLLNAGYTREEILTAMSFDKLNEIKQSSSTQANIDNDDSTIYVPNPYYNGSNISITSDGKNIVSLNGPSGTDSFSCFEYKDNEWSLKGSLYQFSDYNESRSTTYYDNSARTDFVKISDDGSTIIRAANNSSPGMVYIYKFENVNWYRFGEIEYDEMLKQDFELNTNYDGSIIAFGGNNGWGTEGIVKIYKYKDESWSQMGSIISNVECFDLSYDGNKIVCSNNQDSIMYEFKDDVWIQVGNTVTINSEPSWDIITKNCMNKEGNIIALSQSYSNITHTYQLNENNEWVEIGKINVSDKTNARAVCKLSHDGKILGISTSNLLGYHNVTFYKLNSDEWDFMWNFKGDVSNSGYRFDFSLENENFAIAHSDYSENFSWGYYMGRISIYSINKYSIKELSDYYSIKEIASVYSIDELKEYGFTEAELISAGVLNVKPVINDFELKLLQNKSGKVTFNATDANNDTLTYTVENPSNGTIEFVEEKNELKYSPNENYIGSDIINCKVSDGEFEVEFKVNITVLETATTESKIESLEKGKIKFVASSDITTILSIKVIYNGVATNSDTLELVPGVSEGVLEITLTDTNGDVVLVQNEPFTSYNQ